MLGSGKGKLLRSDKGELLVADKGELLELVKGELLGSDKGQQFNILNRTYVDSIQDIHSTNPGSNMINPD